MIKIRNDLKFGAGHMDNYLGKDKVWYLFTVKELHGTRVTRDIALKANPKIEVVTWPYPRWQ